MGPHAKRIYYKYICNEVKEGNLRFDSLVEVETKAQDVRAFLQNKDVKPAHILLCSKERSIAPKELDSQVKKYLDHSIRDGNIQYAIIATEPKAHKAYIEYFLQNSVPVLTDKPLTSPIGSNWSKQSARQILKDALLLEALSRKMKTRLYVQAQRREHPAYTFIFDTARKIVDQFNVPITFFSIYHSDGTWSMPGEFASRENHPYKYGYGKLLHSGYHFVDILAQIVEMNRRIYPGLRVENRTRLLKPHEHYHQIGARSLYQRLFGIETERPAARKLGEIDSYSSVTLYDAKTTRPIAFGHLDLLQSGFSKRAWYALPEDTYKGNGRIRHEYLNMHIGPLLNIQLHSYQSDESDRGIKEGPGGEEHLEVYVFRNNEIIGGKPFEVIDFGKIIREEWLDDASYIGQNEMARHFVFKKFLRNETSKAEIGNQVLTNAILTSIFMSAITGRTNRANT